MSKRAHRQRSNRPRSRGKRLKLPDHGFYCLVCARWSAAWPMSCDHEEAESAAAFLANAPDHLRAMARQRLEASP